MATKQDQEITIIIVTHNSSLVIGECLDKIKDCTHPIIIVDCKSSDNTITKIETTNPSIKIFSSKTNLGYGNANNLGATKATSKYLLFLNPDALITPTTISTVLESLSKNPKIGVAGVQINDTKHTERTAGNILYQSDILGAVFFIKSEIFDQLNGFDRNIFLYGEENDLCSRVEKAGYENAVILDAKAAHINQGSSPKTWQYDYLRGYHSCWSKLYLRTKKKGPLKTSYIIPKFIIKSFILSLTGLLSLDIHKAAWNIGSISGSFNYAIGRKAFDKHNNPRGFFKA